MIVIAEPACGYMKHGILCICATNSPREALINSVNLWILCITRTLLMRCRVAAAPADAL